MTTKSAKKKVPKTVKTTPQSLRPTVSLRPVSWRLATLLRDLDAAMVAEFGPHDMAYVVTGDGKVLGASSGEHGVVVPDIEAEPVEGRVYLPSELWQMPDDTRVESSLLGVGVIRAAGKVENTDRDERVVTFESGTEYVLPVPGPAVIPPPWDHVIRVIRPDVEISTLYADEV